MKFNPTDSILSIVVAAKKLDVSRKLLKKYEREGLLNTYKTESDHRFIYKDILLITFQHFLSSDHLPCSLIGL